MQGMEEEFNKEMRILKNILKVKSLISQFKISLESFINILTQEEDRTLWLEDKVDKLEHLDNNKE